MDTITKLPNDDQSTGQKYQESSTKKNIFMTKKWILFLAGVMLLTVSIFAFILTQRKPDTGYPSKSEVEMNYKTAPTSQISDSGTQRATKKYTNNTFGITLLYPKDWMGPEVYQNNDGFVFEVGSDTVYPYGTSIEDRIYTKKNSYYITFQYTKKPLDQTITAYKANQPWLQQYLSYLLLNNGESKSDARSLITRVKSVRSGPYAGIEYISTLSDTAQTEITYSREVFLLDSNYNTIRISGRPQNVTMQDKKNWKTYYKEVDDENLSTFEDFVNSIAIIN